MYLNTVRLPWFSLREGTTQTTYQTLFTYADWPTHGIDNLRSHPQLKDANGFGIMMWGTAAADRTTAYKLWGRTRQNGEMVLLLVGVATLGSRVATKDPITGVAITSGLYVDTITATGGILQDLVDILDSGNNGICILKMDSLYFNDVALEFDVNAGGGTAITTAYAAITGY